MAKINAEKLAQAIYGYFEESENNRPFTFNEDKEDLSVDIDGTLYCHELAAWVAEKMGAE